MQDGVTIPGSAQKIPGRAQKWRLGQGLVLNTVLLQG